ncbi:MAG TPA: hypothetical protein VFS21_23085 [Roseiflexaceae bacterium]|nr:hypothetical protein [Roseiflexaceae bacterium]
MEIISTLPLLRHPPAATPNSKRYYTRLGATQNSKLKTQNFTHHAG